MQIEAEEIAEEIPKDGGRPPADWQLAERDDIAIEANPAGVIMEAWIRLSSAARMVLSPGNALHALFKDDWADPIQDLEKSNLLSESEKNLVKTLRELRNMAAHSTSRRPTAADAKRFVNIADRLEQQWIFRAAQNDHASKGRE